MTHHHAAFARAFSLAVGLTLLQPLAVFAQDKPTRTETVQFAPGTSGATLSGTITGRDFVTYTLGAEAGQQMSAALTSDNSAIYFNLYEPGRGPGDEALAVGETLPEINHFDGILPTSGIYTISVYLYRNAARAGETANYTLDLAITGDTGAVVEGDFADGLAGGPDFWQITTSGGGTLKLHEAASTGSGVVALLGRGEVVRNLGCRMNEARRWCHVATLADPGVDGWAAGDFLAEAAPPNNIGDALVPGTPFHATGQIECQAQQGSVTALCDFGVIRAGNGTASVTVFWPDGNTRVLYFEAGTATRYDPVPQDANAELTVTRKDDNSVIVIGPQRFVIPDAVIFGG